MKKANVIEEDIYTLRETESQGSVVNVRERLSYIDYHIEEQVRPIEQENEELENEIPSTRRLAMLSQEYKEQANNFNASVDAQNKIVNTFPYDELIASQRQRINDMSAAIELCANNSTDIYLKEIQLLESEKIEARETLGHSLDSGSRSSSTSGEDESKCQQSMVLTDAITKESITNYQILNSKVDKMLKFKKAFMDLAYERNKKQNEFGAYDYGNKTELTTEIPKHGISVHASLMKSIEKVKSMINERKALTERIKNKRDDSMKYAAPKNRNRKTRSRDIDMVEIFNQGLINNEIYIESDVDDENINLEESISIRDQSGVLDDMNYDYFDQDEENDNGADINDNAEHFESVNNHPIEPNISSVEILPKKNNFRAFSKVRVKYVSSDESIRIKGASDESLLEEKSNYSCDCIYGLDRRKSIKLSISNILESSENLDTVTEELSGDLVINKSFQLIKNKKESNWENMDGPICIKPNADELIAEDLFHAEQHLEQTLMDELNKMKHEINISLEEPSCHNDNELFKLNINGRELELNTNNFLAFTEQDITIEKAWGANGTELCTKENLNVNKNRPMFLLENVTEKSTVEFVSELKDCILESTFQLIINKNETDALDLHSKVVTDTIAKGETLQLKDQLEMGNFVKGNIKQNQVKGVGQKKAEASPTEYESDFPKKELYACSEHSITSNPPNEELELKRKFNKPLTQSSLVIRREHEHKFVEFSDKTKGSEIENNEQNTIQSTVKGDLDWLKSENLVQEEISPEVKGHENDASIPFRPDVITTKITGKNKSKEKIKLEVSKEYVLKESVSRLYLREENFSLLNISEVNSEEQKEEERKDNSTLKPTFGEDLEENVEPVKESPQQKSKELTLNDLDYYSKYKSAELENFFDKHWKSDESVMKILFFNEKEGRELLIKDYLSIEKHNQSPAENKTSENIGKTETITSESANTGNQEVNGEIIE